MKGNVKILRFDKAKPEMPFLASYSFDFTPGMTCLDVLNQLRETQDSTLGYDFGCRNGHCGACGVKMNGKSVLLCRCPAEPEMLFEPLSGFPVRKDLSIDRSAYDKKKKALCLHISRKEPYTDPARPEAVSPDLMERFKRVSRCIECLLCVSECPVYQSSPEEFAGPAAIIWEARFDADPRDEKDRLPIFLALGTSACIGCGACSAVCPHGIDPAGEIAGIRERMS